ncbi:MAG: 3-oxoacyl-[acyl-carrier-protein] synthase III C-terminal domain-containing protein, partial [Bacteroidota bacterium]
VAQRDGVAWMKAALERSPATGPEATRARRLYDLLGRQTTIESRATALEDYTHQDWDRMEVFSAPASGDGVGGPARPWQTPTLEERMAVFARTAVAVARDAFADDTDAPDLLAQVSCTGYDSPTAVQRVALERGWTASRLLHIGHMGCYAAVPALMTAADAVSALAARRAASGADAEAASGAVATSPEADAHAAIVLAEMCTLHHRVEATEPEVVVQQCLFADGAARLDVTAQKPEGRSFALLGHDETLVPDTLGEMTWGLADSAFAMTLSRRVPDHIRAGVGDAVSAFLGTHGLAVDDIDIAAIHPGGPRVIEVTAEALGFSEHQTRHSTAVLHARGNMSSTTLPHIWARIADDTEVASGALVLSLAFGPGLTIAANLLRVEG